MWLNFVAKLVNSNKFPWILRNFNFRKNMYVICMLYVWATYNMAQSLCTRVFAPCHVIRLYVFAKFIKISYRLKGIQLPTEAHFPTDWSLFSLRLKPPFDGNASHSSLQYLLWGYSDASQGWRKPFPWGKGDIPVRVCQFVVSQKSHFLFTEDEPIYALPFSFHFSFNW